MRKILCILITACSICMVANAQAASTDYSILNTLEIMVGDENGDMQYDRNVTRAEFTKVATSISNFRKSIPVSQKTSPFGDVPYYHWASSYIRAGIDNGIVQGYPDSTFRPDNNVKYEEALTILLKILGYTDADFGDSYPYGQYSLAVNIGLTDGVDAQLGEDLTRRQVADLLVNALETNFKNSTQSPYSNFDVTKLEDVVLLATSNEDKSVPSGKVLTTQGTYNYTLDVNGLVGKKGTLILKDGDTVIYFNPEYSGDVNEYAVYSVMNDGVVTYRNGSFSQMSISDNTVAYYGNQTTTFAQIKGSISMGDTISVVNTGSGDIDYINIYKGNYEGPYVYTTASALSGKVGSISDYLILKNGNTVDADELEKNDVYYYYSDLKILMAYNTKITGIYNSATPNQDSPVTIEVSGKTYEIESADAFKALSSAGKYKYGDTVTLLLGKDKKIAAVLGADNTAEKVAGVVIGSGLKTYESDTDKKVTQYYVTIVTPGGDTEEYKTSQDFSSYKNNIVTISFSGDTATVKKIKYDSVPINGTFNYDTMTVGNYTVSKNVSILDVASTDSNDSTLYMSVNPQRIDGVKLSSNNVRYYELNEKGQIIKLILEDVTGDYYSYGYLTKVTDGGESSNASYTYTLDGSEQTFMSQGVTYAVSEGPAKFTVGNGGVTGLQNLYKATGTVSEISSTYVTVGGKNYLMSDDVKVFYRNSNWDFMLITVDDLTADFQYSISGVYYDKSDNLGGRVRVIIVV